MEVFILMVNIFPIFCMQTILFSSHIPPTNSKACITEKSNKIGLTINTDKTKIMRNEFTENTNTIKTNNKEIEKTKKYINPGQTITIMTKQ